MRRQFLWGIAVSLAAFLVRPAFAADAALDWAEPHAGVWTLAGVTEGAPYCALTFGTEGVVGGASIDVSATCRRNFPMEEVAAWTLRGDTIALIDPLRQTVIAFVHQQDGSYSATISDGETVTLDKGAPDAPASRKELLDGSFALSGPNNTSPCGFSVSARTADAGELEQAGQCPALWKAKTWKGWSFAAGHLNLLADDGSVILSLAPADEFTFFTEQPDGPIFFGPGVIEADG